MEFLRMLEGIRSPLLDTVIGFVTSFGEETVLIIVLCAIYWCINKRMAYIIGIAYFVSALVVQGMKIGFRIDRPWVADPSLNPVPSALEHATGYSFPSGHTQSATALFGSLGVQVKQPALKVLCFFIVVLVAFSRLYLGVHTILDVTVSMAITIAIVILVSKLLCSDTVNKKQELIISLSVAFLAIAVIVIATVMHSAEIITQGYVTDCLKAAGVSIGFATGMYIERVYIDFPVRAKNLGLQILKFILGIAGVLIIKEGLKLVIGTSLVADTIRYFLMAIWMTLAYPLIIKRFFRRTPT